MTLPENRIPEEKLPQCWSDDIRMNALFAPFRLRTANPESWEMKMKFWSDMLRQWCRHKRDPILSAADAKFAFQRKGRTPVCVDIVVEEMIRNGEMCTLSKYQQILHNGPEGWMRWGARLAFKPAAFALTAVSSLLPARQAVDGDGLPKASIDPTQRFVLESAVQEQAMTFLEKYPSGIERLGTIEELMRITAWQGSRETFEVILGYLVSQGMAVKKGDVVKLAEPSKKVSSVTESDEALVKLLSTETRLENEATRLSRDIVATEADAKAALQLGNRLAAKNHLRKKHKLQQRSEQIHSTLENVQHLLHQLRQADTNTVILDTYKSSSEAMKRGMKDEGLSEDAVLDTMDELKEVIQNYNDIEKALAGSTDDLDAEELEQELRDLLSGAGGASPSGGTPAKDENKRREVPNLPTPPRAKPESKSPDFFFDGEQRMIEELNKLSVEDTSPRDKGRRLEKPVAVGLQVKEPQPKKQSQLWYPPSNQCLHPTTTWDNNNGYGELRQDDRIHPGQPLNIDFTKPPTLYSDEFAVKDHKLSSGVWLYNADNNNLRQSQYDSPNNSSVQSTDRPFQMAPGGERKHTHQSWPTDEEPATEELEKRLRNLRGFNL